MRPLIALLLFTTPLLAAPVPAEEKPKPRAKLLGTLKVNKPVEQAIWTPDAKHLILIAENKGLVVGRDQLGEDAVAKPVAEFDLPAGGGVRLGITPDGTEVYAVASAGGRFNSETRLCFWTLKDLLDGKKKTKPDRVVSLEADNPTEYALTSDAKALFAVMTEMKASAQSGEAARQTGKVVRVSTKTGDITTEVMALEEQEATLLGAAVHPESGRVFAHFQTSDEHVIRGFDTETKKAKWVRKIDQPWGNVSGQSPRVSPDGKTLVVFCSRLGQGALLPPLPPGGLPPGAPVPLQPAGAGNTIRPHLLNATTGDVIAELGGDDVQACDVCDFSHDGKLMFGWLSGSTGIRHVVWDTKTGKPLKTWLRGPSGVTAAFAPGRHELVSVEQVNNAVGVMPNAYPSPNPGIAPLLGVQTFYLPQQEPAVRVESHSIVGVWDLAPLAK